MWTTHDEKTSQKLLGIEQEIQEILEFPPTTFKTEKDIDNLTVEQAEMVIREARRMMLKQALYQETHEHWLDDCGDYLEAATYNWNALYQDVFFMNDGQEEAVIDGVKSFLKMQGFPLGGSDGEIRHYLLSEELFDLMESKYHE